MEDVFYKIDYEYNKGRYKSKASGKEMDSSDYIDWAEKAVFGKTVRSTLRFEYGKIIKEDLQKIGDAIKRDIEDGKKNNDYIASFNAKSFSYIFKWDKTYIFR